MASLVPPIFCALALTCHNGHEMAGTRPAISLWGWVRPRVNLSAS